MYRRYRVPLYITYVDREINPADQVQHASRPKGRAAAGVSGLS